MLAKYLPGKESYFFFTLIVFAVSIKIDVLKENFVKGMVAYFTAILK
jgi:hypothetical protein